MIDEKFITEWVACQEGNLDNEEPDLHWTDEYLIDLSITDNGSHELWAFILNTYTRKLSDSVISILAAGPLEDVLAHDGDLFIEQVEELARKDPKFKHLLGGVWQNAMSQELWTRVCKARGTSW